MQGFVTDARTGKPMYPVTVVNRNTNKAVFTDENGFYVLPAATSDVVVFSYLGYKSVELAKPGAVIIANQDITMEPSGFLLPEFKFRPGHLTKYQQDSADRAVIYKLPLQRRPPPVFVSPISALAEKFSRKAKATYRFQKMFIAGEQEKFIDTRYTPVLVSALTGLEGDSIGLFMYHFPLPYDFARVASELELKMWIRNNYRQWTPVADTAQH